MMGTATLSLFTVQRGFYSKFQAQFKAHARENGAGIL